ncbi:Uncharacterised protein [Bordetella pertussis]|nr:Uncharacterised protein [Bordetella pertussis]
MNSATTSFWPMPRACSMAAAWRMRWWNSA